MTKKSFLAAAASLAVVTAVAIPSRSQNATSERAARVLQEKIDAIQAAEKKGNDRKTETVTVTEVELESYVLFEMRDEIPARIDTFDVQLTDGAVAADTRLTFAADATANPLLDFLIAGTHNLFVKGTLSAAAGRGKFQLEEAKVDGIPVPTILIESLIARYVKPKYPDVDLNKDFPMPWGIDALTITPGKAAIVY